MMNRLLILLVSILTQSAMGEAAFQYGPRPVSGIFDPERSLSPEMTRQLTDQLSTVRKRDLADVLVVILPATGEVPPEHLASRFSDAWGKGALHAVVFDALNRTDGPWIVFGGEVVRSDHGEIIPQMAADILRRAHQEPDRESALRAAALETTDILRYLLGKVQTQGEAFRTNRLRQELDYQRHQQFKKYLLYGGAAAFFPVMALLALLLMALLRRRTRRFPAILWTRRFGAPYAGGNDATVDLSRRTPLS